MRKKYVAPEMETVKFDFKDVIRTSIIEETIPEIIIGDDDGGELDF